MLAITNIQLLFQSQQNIDRKIICFPHRHVDIPRSHCNQLWYVWLDESISH